MAVLPGVPGGYSWAEVYGSFFHPLAGSFTIGGQIGMGSIEFEMMTERNTMQTTADGYVLTNTMLGLSGKVTLSCLQGSSLDQYLMGWANDVDAAIVGGDSTVAFAGTFRVTDISTQNKHTGLGVSISKQPPRSYQATAQLRPWVLYVAELSNA